MGFERVKKSNPCPVCGKPDWCLVAPDESAAICARVEEGAVKRCGDAGWLHILRTDSAKHPKRRSLSKPTIAERSETDDKGFEQLAEEYQRQLTSEQFCALAESLGVSVASLKRLRIGWDGAAYTFPMSDSENRIIGVRRRSPSGHKLSVTGSKNGLFIPTGLRGYELLLIVEGESDLAAALDLNFDGMGRPSCNSKVEMTVKAVKGRRQIVIVGDGDAPGRAGAEKLANALAIHCPSVKVVYPPDGTKDLRQWLCAGLRPETLQRIIEATEPIKLKVRFRD